MENAIDLTPQHMDPLLTAPDFVKDIYRSLAKKVEQAQPEAIHHALNTCNSNQDKTGLSLFGQQKKNEPLQCYASVFEVQHALDIDHGIVVMQRDANHPLIRVCMTYIPVNGVYPIDEIAEDIVDFWLGTK